MRFIPRDEKFFDCFEELADRIEAGGKLFLEMVEGGVYGLQVARIKEIEHEADDITHRTYEKMHRTFLTPLDREDIYSLVNKMDSILDMIEASAARLILYKVKEPATAIIQQARVLCESIGKVKIIIHSIKDMKNAPLILQTCVEINTLENEGDVILRTTMANLFENEKDVRELIKWKEIHERIEEAIDVCEDVSNIVEGIVLKMADAALVVFLILIALVFDFINGFHDAANSIATVVSTRVLKPQHAVLWAAFFNFVAAFFFETKVATTIGKGVVDPGAITLAVVAAGLVGAIVWNLITWWLGLPSSSSHALIGGLAGAAVVHAGWGVLQGAGILKITIFIVLSPLIGFLLGFLYTVGVLWIVHRKTPAKVDGIFRKLQLFSAGAYSLAHGLNDAQKTMGIIMLILVSTGHMTTAELSRHAPLWIILSCHGAIALGTLFGGWRIVKTMGVRLTKLAPIGGFAAEAAGATTIIGASLAGIPVSTTHTITGAIVGVGSTHRLTAVRWGVAGTIVWAWVLTIPLSALIAAAIYALLSLIV